MATRMATRSCKDVVPINAARMFKNPAPVLSSPRVVDLLDDKVRRSVLEVGGGCLRNALYLQRCGFNVTVLEVKGIESRFPDEYAALKRLGGKVVYMMPKKSFDWAIMTFVIETICRTEVRKSLVKSVRNQLRTGGYCILSVRGPRDLVTATSKGQPVSDGFLTPGGTFARSYTKSQLTKLLKACGFAELEYLHKPSVQAPELLHVIAKLDTTLGDKLSRGENSIAKRR